MQIGEERGPFASSSAAVLALRPVWLLRRWRPASADIGADPDRVEELHGRRGALPALRPGAGGARARRSRSEPDIGPTEATFAAAPAGRVRRLRRVPGHAARVPRAARRRNNSERTHAALEALLEPLGLVVSEAAPAVDVNGFYVMRKTAREVQAHDRVRPEEGRRQAHVRRAARVRSTGRCASAARRRGSTACGSRRSRSSTPAAPRPGLRSSPARRRRPALHRRAA